MAVQTVIQRNSLVDKYKADCTFISLTSATPAATATEVTGVTRAAAAWGATANSAATSSPAAISVSSGQTVAGVAFYDAVTAGNYRDGAGVTSQAFSAAGTYQPTATFTQS